MVKLEPELANVKCSCTENPKITHRSLTNIIKQVPKMIKTIKHILHEERFKYLKCEDTLDIQYTVITCQEEGVQKMIWHNQDGKSCSGYNQRIFLEVPCFVEY